MGLKRTSQLVDKREILECKKSQEQLSIKKMQKITILPNQFLIALPNKSDIETIFLTLKLLTNLLGSPKAKLKEVKS